MHAYCSGHQCVHVVTQSCGERTNCNAFRWLPQASQLAVYTVKRLKCHAVLVMPNCSKALELIADAVGFGVGAALLQEGHALHFCAGSSLMLNEIIV